VKGSEGTSLLIICLYLDDLMLTGSNIQDIEDFKSVMKSEFENSQNLKGIDTPSNQICS